MHPRPECPRCSAPRSCGRSASERPAAFGRWRGSGGPRTGCYGGWLTAALTDEPSYVCQRAEVAELLRVDHRSDRLDDALCDVEGEDADKAALVVHDDGTGLAVHHPTPDLDPGRDELPSRADQQAGDTIRAGDRLQPGRPLASAVPVERPQPIELVLARRRGSDLVSARDELRREPPADCSAPSCEKHAHRKVLSLVVVYLPRRARTSRRDELPSSRA